MNSHETVRISQNVPTQYYGQGSDFPGVGQLTPFYPEVQSPYLPAVPVPVPNPASNNILSNFSFKDFKGFVDRMGGVEGLMGTLTKVQQTMKTVQQMAPMLKLLLPKLGSQSLDDENYRRPRRRRRGTRRKNYSSQSSSYSRGKVRRSGTKSKKRRRAY